MVQKKQRAIPGVATPARSTKSDGGLIDKTDESHQRDQTLRIWQIYREYVIQEDALMDRRLGNLLVHQAFLLAAAAAVLTKVIEYLTNQNSPPQTSPPTFFGITFARLDLIGESFVGIVALVGLWAACASQRSIRSGDLALRALRCSWEKWKENSRMTSVHDWSGIEITPERANPKDQVKCTFDPYGLPGIQYAGSEAVRAASRPLPIVGHLPLLFVTLWLVLIVAMVLLAVGIHLPQPSPKSTPAHSAAVTMG